MIGVQIEISTRPTSYEEAEAQQYGKQSKLKYNICRVIVKNSTRKINLLDDANE